LRRRKGGWPASFSLTLSCAGIEQDNDADVRDLSGCVLRARRVRPSSSGAAQRDDQFLPSDVDCHVITPLGCCRCSEAAPEMASR
jgi:hypothetical protein